MKGKTVDRWTPRTTLAAVARSTLLDALTRNQLAVYIKLLGASDTQGSRRVQILNGELCRDHRTAVRALRELEDMGLVRIHYDTTALGRTIEVAP